MNDFFYYFCRNAAGAIPWLFSRHYRDGFELVPKTGPALLLCNHISHFDPPFMMFGFPRVVHFMADKMMTNLPLIGRLLQWGHVFAIDRTKNDRAAIRTARQRLEAGNVIAIFPEKGIRHGATSVLGGAELPIGTASFWKLMDVPVIPMVILGSDQMYALSAYPRFPRIFSRIGPPLAPDAAASREQLRDRIVAAWRVLYESLIRDYAIRPEELPQSAQERWQRKAPVPPAVP